MGIIVDPVTKKLPHPQVGSYYGMDILNHKSRQHWNAPTEEFETLLNTMIILCRNDVCTIIWLLQLVKQVSSVLSSFAPPHMDTLTVQFPVGW